MGKVTEILHEIRSMDDIILFDRFDHLTRAQAIREYLDSKPERALNMELSLSREEILRRMADRDCKIVKLES